MIGKENKQLTPAEMEVMNRLWSLGRSASVKDIIELYPDPKPAYNTTATFLKILTAKGFVSGEKHTDCGKTLFFRPLISKAEYTKRVMKEVKDNFFSGSLTSLVNFFVREEQISDEEIAELLNMINEVANNK